jgi:flavodoxin
MKAAVIYATHFGTTEKVARSLEVGLREAGLDTTCLGLGDFDTATLPQYDLLCVGAPTEMFTAYRPMKDFLSSIGSASLEGKLGFAFDTKLDSRLSGSAAKYVEHALGELGMRIAAPRESAIVTNTKERGTITGANLRDGEEERFHRIGLKLGESLRVARPAV